MDTHVMGGAEQYLADTIRGMKARGYEVTLVCHAFPALVDFIRRETNDACDIEAVPFSSITRNAAVQSGLALNRSWAGRLGLLKIPGLLLVYWNTFKAFRKLKKIFRRLSPDIVHINSGGYPAGESLRAAVLAAESVDAPRRVMTVHNQAAPLPVPALAEKALDRRVQGALFHVVTASRDAREALLERRAFDAKKVSVVYYGVSEPEAATDVGELRRDLGVPTDGKLVGAIGAFQERKGHLLLLEAFAKVASQRPEVHLVILGEGPLRVSLEEKRKTLNLSGRVFMPGHRPRARRYLAAMDVFAFTSLAYECLPYVILEAMAAGRPIVASRVGGSVEEIEHDVSGWLVPPGDAGAMAEGLERALSNEKRSAAWGEAAVAAARKKFSLPRMWDETEALYC